MLPVDSDGDEGGVPKGTRMRNVDALNDIAQFDVKPLEQKVRVKDIKGLQLPEADQKLHV